MKSNNSVKQLIYEVKGGELEKKKGQIKNNANRKSDIGLYIFN